MDTIALTLGSPDDRTVSAQVSVSAAQHLAAWTTDQAVAAGHEAGHCVAACVLRIAVKAVDTRGRGHARTETNEMDDTVPVALTTSRLRDRIVVDLSGLAAEVELLGEGTTGSAYDLEMATNRALELVAAGLDDSAPFVSYRPFGQYNTIKLPEIISDAMGAAVVATLADCRRRAQEIAHERRDTIAALGRIIFAERRLADRRLFDVLASLGLDPVDPGL